MFRHQTFRERIPNHEDRSIRAKTICGLALSGVDSGEPQVSFKPSFGA